MLIDTIVQWINWFDILGIYGYIFLPSGWTSFDEHDTSEYKRIQNNVGGYGTVALAIIFLMNFITRFAIGSIPGIVASEVFPFKYYNSFKCTGLISELIRFFVGILDRVRFFVALQQHFNMDLRQLLLKPITRQKCCYRYQALASCTESSRLLGN